MPSTTRSSTSERRRIPDSDGSRLRKVTAQKDLKRSCRPSTCMKPAIAVAVAAGLVTLAFVGSALVRRKRKSGQNLEPESDPDPELRDGPRQVCCVVLCCVVLCCVVLCCKYLRTCHSVVFSLC